MNIFLIVILCGFAAALLAFGISVSRRIKADLVDPTVEEQAVTRSIIRHPRIRRFLQERMDRKTAGGFMLSASFIILFAASLLVGFLLAMIDNNSWLAQADKSISTWGMRNDSTATFKALKLVTYLGGTPVVAIALTITAIVDYARRRSREVFVFMAVIGFGEFLLHNSLKVIIGRERPPIEGRVVFAHGFSFPSGHTAAATAAAFAIALVFGRDKSRQTRALLAGGATLVAISVAASRALLGVHWLSDVIAGLAVGWGWFMIVAIIFGGRQQRLGDPIDPNPSLSLR